MLHLTCYVESFYINIITKQNHNIVTIPFEKSKTVSFTSSIMKNVVAPYALIRLSAKLICCIYFGSAFTFSGLLKSIAINL